MTREELLNQTVFETKFVVEDILRSRRSDELQEKIFNLSDEELEKFINDNIHSWSKGFECGIMDNWHIVGNTCFDESDFTILDEIEDEAREFIEQHLGEIEGLYRDDYYRWGGHNGLSVALEEVAKRYSYTFHPSIEPTELLHKIRKGE